MSEVKLFEIRDAATFIPVAAVASTNGGDLSQRSWLLGRGGWAAGTGPVHLFRLDERGRGYSDPVGWGTQTRTMIVAHRHILAEWDWLVSGDVIDVEFLLGLRDEPKTTERAGGL